jgi:hypothetical protein
LKLKVVFVCLTLLVLAVVFASCDNGVGPGRGSSGNEGGTSYPDSLKEMQQLLEQTPRPDTEAELAALWLSGGLVAPGELYTRLHKGFKELRKLYADSIPEVKIPFIFPVEPSRIFLQLTRSAAEQLRAGTYTEWDTLNQIFRVTEIDTTILFSRHHYVWLEFQGFLHPAVVAEYYRNLKGVVLAGTNGYAGDWSCTYPWIHGDRLTFLVRKAWGDCPSGCIYSHFWYFKETDSGFALIGDWNSTMSAHPPQWWDEAKIAFLRYRGLYGP